MICTETTCTSEIYR